VKKNETLRGRGVFRTLITGGRRLDGTVLRCYYQMVPGQARALQIGVGMQDRGSGAVRRNRVRRRIRAAVDLERRRLNAGVADRSSALLVLFTLRRGVDPVRTGFPAIHADLARLCTTLLARLSRPRS
jgi:ribonuclease P protein component